MGSEEHRAPKSGLILAVNAGSSSLKISLFKRSPSPSPSPNDDSHAVELLLTSTIDNISAPPARFSFALAAHAEGRETKKEPVERVRDHASAFAHFLDYLKREASIDRAQIVHVCHRVVHGGDYFKPVVITDESYHHIERLSDLAPLHNGGALSVIKACIDALPNASSIAYFDTSFHRTIPEHIAMYAICQDVARRRGLKKYGFHGLSYAFILRAVSAHLQRPPASLNLIVLHLGSGASMCAVAGGQSLDTTMGLTPVSGLPGATRCGVIDPSLIFHYTNRAGRISHDRSLAVDVHVTEAEEILNKRSGWAALTGTTDFGEIVRNMKRVEERGRRGVKGDEGEGQEEGQEEEEEGKWRTAFDLFVDRILGFLGGYYLKLGGKVDALVFAGGIGERSVELREAVLDKAACLGFELDPEANGKVDGDESVVVDVGKGKEGKRVLVCRTDEQLEMAKECALDSRFWEE
ncbi:acetate and butyrate kinase [Dichomitus squalens LYAD-421 SS1]|uniref:acetate and butyrate kinase n=1 Tax=Dichomitus squalens (strain LYAD-421) TaxID=732165 RepID=UPI0004410AE0|nr:acetate and butyrate kinase [Dichomitus squalens LYAD-421 SS1]EJF64671.1 acetate and butyrate kinase [Dichomitus squalens LYAD-421 SS1]